MDAGQVDGGPLSYEMQWEAWGRGEARCPYCVDLDDDDFKVVCDCSRWYFEKTGHQLGIAVIGTDITTPVMPIQATEEREGEE